MEPAGNPRDMGGRQDSSDVGMVGQQGQRGVTEGRYGGCSVGVVVSTRDVGNYKVHGHRTMGRTGRRWGRQARARGQGGGRRGGRKRNRERWGAKIAFEPNPRRKAMPDGKFPIVADLGSQTQHAVCRVPPTPISA